MNTIQNIHTASSGPSNRTGLYPGVYYELLPHVREAVRRLGVGVPGEAILQEMTAQVLADATREQPAFVPARSGIRGRYPRKPSRRGGGSNTGFLGDLIRIMLLNELFGRRGYPYPYPYPYPYRR